MDRLSLALLCGSGFSALDAILLGGPAWVALPASFLLFPGGFFVEILLHSDSPFAKIAGNALIYSGLVYVFLLLRRDLSARFLRLASISMIFPAALFIALASTPKFDALFPRGLVELTRQENDLRSDFPDNMEIGQARAALKARNIQFFESAPSVGRVAQREGMDMRAASGDHLIYSRFPSTASQFPCGFDMEVYLLFDASAKLKQSYVRRFRICP